MNPIHFLYGPFQGRTVQGLRNEDVPQVESGHLPETGATAGGGNFPSVDSRPPGHHEEQSCVRTGEDHARRRNQPPALRAPPLNRQTWG